MLIAEDDPSVRRLIEVTVKNSGCDVVTAANGEQALQLARELHPRLVILDVTMPLMTGTEVGKELKADPATQDLPIVFLTSHAQEDDVLEGFRSGAVDYLFKPFSPKELQVRVRSVLARA